MRMWNWATFTMDMHERSAVYNPSCVPLLGYEVEFCIAEMYFRAAVRLE